LDYLKFQIALSSQTVGKNYTLALKEISACYSNITVGFVSPKMTQQIKVYPNPTKGNDVTLVLDKPQAVAFDVINLNGQIIKTIDMGIQKQTEVILPLQGLSQGTYFIKIRQENQSDIVKIIIN